MPYKDPAARRAQRERWAAAHRYEELARKARFRAEDRHHARDYHNERNFRFKMWECARMKPVVREMLELLFVGTPLQVDNPQFIFIYNGRRQYVETLYDPLPEIPLRQPDEQLYQDGKNQRAKDVLLDATAPPASGTMP